MLSFVFSLATAAYLGLVVCFPFVTPQLTTQAQGADNYYSWTTFTGTQSPGLDLSGLKPLQSATGSVLEVKLPFTFPFYGRPQTTIYIDPAGFIFPHRLSVAGCPRWLCLNGARNQSFIAPLSLSQSGAAKLSLSTKYYHRRGVAPTSNAVVVTWSGMHGAQCDTAPSTCSRVEFSATLYESGKINFHYQQLPQFTVIQSDLAYHPIGLLDATVFGGYGSIRTNEDINGDLLSLIDLNAKGELYSATSKPTNVSFVSLRGLIQNGTARVANASRAGQTFGRDCSQAQSRDLCDQMPDGLHCFWCVAKKANEFQPFCGHRDDTDPRADIIFAGKCGEVLINFENDAIPIDALPPSPGQTATFTVLGHDYYTTHVDGEDAHTHHPGGGSHDDNHHDGGNHGQHHDGHHAEVHVPMASQYRLHTRYTSDSPVTLPFKFPFYQRSLEKLTIRHTGFLYIPGHDCTSCVIDPLIEDPLLFSHIAPLAGIWDFGPHHTRLGHVSAMSRYDAIDNSFVHFEWANAQLSVFLHDCPALHCRLCLCPAKGIDPVTFSATLYRNGTIAFHYSNFSTAMNAMPFDKYYGGHIGIHDVLASEPPTGKTPPTIFEYQNADGSELHHHDDHSHHSVVFRPIATPTCNQARTRKECESNPGSQEPCLWCEATDGYTLRPERTFCSASRQTYHQEIKTSSLQCRYFSGQATHLPPTQDTTNGGAKKSSASIGVIAGGVVGCLVAAALFVAAVLYLRRLRQQGSNGSGRDMSVNFKQFNDEA